MTKKVNDATLSTDNDLNDGVLMARLESGEIARGEEKDEEEEEEEVRFQRADSRTAGKMGGAQPD